MFGGPIWSEWVPPVLYYESKLSPLQRSESCNLLHISLDAENSTFLPAVSFYGNGGELRSQKASIQSILRLIFKEAFAFALREGDIYLSLQSMATPTENFVLSKASMETYTTSEPRRNRTTCDSPPPEVWLTRAPHSQLAAQSLLHLIHLVLSLKYDWRRSLRQIY
ncbi:hypothetical protein Plhal304r1_c039g0117281 [Plasmopara halstedii]